MLMRILGGGLVCLSATLIGWYIGGSGGRRAGGLMELKKSLILLKSQIDHAIYTLPQAFGNISHKVAAPLDGFYKRLAEKPDSWADEALRLSGSNLHKDDLANLSLLGASLGQGDTLVQINSIDMVIAAIDDTLNQLTVKNRSDTKMWRSLGVVGGLLITIALL
ncbi:MAG: stage III sporulation protein AB [Defluviitaleaceae bacterium]|nr:stage III sporulation protein AB [Defluviitaleaceae bacterium]